MVYQPPAGARDLLPLDVAQKCWIEERLQQVFDRWGYHRIITSTLERLDTLMAGGAIQRSAVIQLQDAQEELGLRPELTASIARTAVTRMAGSTYPQRLYYHANVFSRTKGSSLNRQQEFYQSGIELLGSSGFLADAEVLLVLAECLNQLGLSDWCLVLGEAGIARSLLSTFPEAIQDQVRQAIAHLDRVTIDTLPLSPELQERARIMLDLRGRPTDVLQQVGSLELDFPQKEALNHLKSLILLLDEYYSVSASKSTAKFPLILDLSLLQTIDYYTGIVFEVVSNTNMQPQILGRGGRYDQLLELYHPQRVKIPGIGFMLNIEDLHQVLLANNQLPQAIPANNWLVVPQTPQAYAAAFSYAEKLRNSVHLVRVEIDLGGRDPLEIREYARRRCIQQIAWIKTTGSPIIEPVTAEHVAPYIDI
ncbi:MAG: ATP phosphoribosyltransferase regulatory subunit [Chroococcidiopsidaceae cyanobacterium CP_BM_ER_R8_30]|nr:ATP phosphoribosyltransferase regulatory subunit [Chroococcidiopsidaceae cyanobacterium CP_BM_ER_R8_30]